MTTCNDVCEHTPSTYGSDIPALKGSPASASVGKFDTFRLEKLVGALAAFLLGCTLMVFHAIDSRGTRAGGEKALVELVKATKIAPSATGRGRVS